MRYKVLICLVSVLVLVSLLVLGCGSTGGPTQAQNQRFNISVGSATGSTTLAGSAVAGVLKRYMSIDATVLNYPTVLREAAVGRGETQLGVGMWLYGDRAYLGQLEAAPGEKFPDLREVYPVWPMYLQVFVLADSPVKSFRDLVGKKMSPGTKAFSSWDILAAGMPAIGINYEKDLNPQYMGHEEGGSALVAGKVDAYVYTGLTPFATFQKIDLTRPVKLIGFTKEDADKVAAATAGIGVGTIPATAYHMDKEVTTLTSVNVLVAQKNLSEDTVYNLVKNTFEHTDYIGYFVKDMQDFMKQGGDAKKFVEGWPAAKMPFHAGAVRYFKEIGWNVPKDRIPPEYKGK